jgi:hypothetical protein
MEKMREEFETWFRKKLGLGADAQFHRDDQVYLNRWETWQAARSSPQKLEKPVRIGGVNFHPGVSIDTVLRAAEQRYEWHCSIPAGSGEAVSQCPNCLGTTKPSKLDPEWRGRCECKGAVPEGWQLVPVEPTHGMCQQCDSPRTAQAYYRAMLSAAPQPKGDATGDAFAAVITDELLDKIMDHVRYRNMFKSCKSELRALLAKGAQ